MTNGGGKHGTRTEKNPEKTGSEALPEVAEKKEVASEKVNT